MMPLTLGAGLPYTKNFYQFYILEACKKPTRG